MLSRTTLSRNLRVAVIGAGFAGIGAAIELQRAAITIYQRGRVDILWSGGTARYWWLTRRFRRRDFR